MTEERWIEGKRRDGLAVVAGLDGYVIMPAEGGLPIAHCPCCDKAFPLGAKGRRGAKLVADALYPMTEPDDAN